MTGVKQGCLLSPLLFSLYINDLVDDLNNSNVSRICADDCYLSCLLYADDLAVVSDTPFSLQQKIYIIANWCAKWRIEINLDKTKIIIFRNGVKLKSIEKWVMNDKPIEVVSFYKYLGVIFSVKGLWTATQKNLVEQAQKVCNVVVRKIRSNEFIDCNLWKTIFDTKIVSMLMYCSEIWGVDGCNIIEKVQYRFCKQMLGLSKY
jgi:hypothetical protein